MARLRRAFVILLSLALLSSCAQTLPEEDHTLHILATTYPVYLFTTAVVGGAKNVEVELLVNSQTSCLHDYTLTVKDMKTIEGADVIIMNGAGMEEFMADALSQSAAAVIDCSDEVPLLPTLEHAGHDGHDHEEEYDPHYWMGCPEVAVFTIGNALADLTGSEEYQTRAFDVSNKLLDFGDSWCKTLHGPYPIERPPLITFHDGFQYFANAYGLELLKAIEEEEGAAVSDAEIKEIVALIEENHIPAIFVERNGSRKTADVIARETGCTVYELDMLMSGDGEGIQPYLDAMDRNLTTILEAFS